ncbi:MAG: hypothetical protein ACK5R4_08980 [Alphaproteobacteria bacterium]|jgi:hypothetical protein
MKKIAAILLASSLFTTPALAGVVGDVKSPEVTQGKLEFEYSGVRYGDDSGSSNNNLQQHGFEVTYGLTDRFRLGLEAEAERESGESFDVEAYGVNAKYELTGQGAWWLSSALSGGYDFADKNDNPDEGSLKLLLQRNQEKWEFLVNLNMSREFGDNHEGGLTLTSNTQAVYNLFAYANPGLEWHAEYGKANDLNNSDTRAHYLGPVVTGVVFETEKSELEYEAGYFLGINDNAADNAARVLLAYAIKI